MLKPFLAINPLSMGSPTQTILFTFISVPFHQPARQTRRVMGKPRISLQVRRIPRKKGGGVTLGGATL
jgi:hypothetical protein